MTIFDKLFHRDALQYENGEQQPEADRVEALEKDLTLLEKQLEVFNLERGSERASDS